MYSLSIGNSYLSGHPVFLFAKSANPQELVINNTGKELWKHFAKSQVVSSFRAGSAESAVTSSSSALNLLFHHHEREFASGPPYLRTVPEMQGICSVLGGKHSVLSA